MLDFRYKLQLHDRGIGHQSGPAIIGSGGVVLVTAAGSRAKATIQDRDGAALSNPLALTRGGAEFYCDSAEVDLFIMCPDGQFVTLWDVAPDEVHEVPVDRGQIDQMLVIPFDIDDYPAATETDTGFDEPAQALFQPQPAVKVEVLDATETIDVGTATADGGDPNGFLAAASVNAAVLVKGSLANGALTMGALLFVQDSANAGDEAPESHVSTSRSIVITTTAGSDTCEGYVYLPYKLLPYNQPTVT